MKYILLIILFFLMELKLSFSYSNYLKDFNILMAIFIYTSMIILAAAGAIIIVKEKKREKL